MRTFFAMVLAGTMTAAVAGQSFEGPLDIHIMSNAPEGLERCHYVNPATDFSTPVGPPDCPGTYVVDYIEYVPDPGGGPPIPVMTHSHTYSSTRNRSVIYFNAVKRDNYHYPPHEVSDGGLGADRHTVDVCVDYGLPPNTSAVFVSGILIITSGYQTVHPSFDPARIESDNYGGAGAYTAEIEVVLRPAGSSSLSHIGQAVAYQDAAGVRTPMSTWVGVENCEFEFLWRRDPAPDHPFGPSYGVNLRLQAYATPSGN